MNFVYAGVGLIVGIALGYVMCLWVARELEAENRELREALRAIRWGRAGIGLAMLRYIDRVLGDEAA